MNRVVFIPAVHWNDITYALAQRASRLRTEFSLVHWNDPRFDVLHREITMTEQRLGRALTWHAKQTKGERHEQL